MTSKEIKTKKLTFKFAIALFTTAFLLQVSRQKAVHEQPVTLPARGCWIGLCDWRQMRQNLQCRTMQLPTAHESHNAR